MNIGHSFKYAITNMIVAWGRPSVIFPSCIFSQVENMAPQQRNQQWWHLTGGCPTKVLNCLTQKQNIPFILNETKWARSSDRAYVPQICLSLFRHNTYDGVHKTKQKCVDNNIRSFMIVSHTSITYLGALRIIQKDILKLPWTFFRWKVINLNLYQQM